MLLGIITITETFKVSCGVAIFVDFGRKKKKGFGPSTLSAELKGNVC